MSYLEPRPGLYRLTQGPISALRKDPCLAEIPLQNKDLDKSKGSADMVLGSFKISCHWLGSLRISNPHKISKMLWASAAQLFSLPKPSTESMQENI